MHIRSNASGKTLLRYFIEQFEGKTGRKYYVVVPWDEKNLSQLKEYYTVELLIELINHYFKFQIGPWSVKDFMYKISDLAGSLEEYKISREHYKNLMKQTQDRMKEAGYY